MFLKFMSYSIMIPSKLMTLEEPLLLVASTASIEKS